MRGRTLGEKRLGCFIYSILVGFLPVGVFNLFNRASTVYEIQYSYAHIYPRWGSLL